MEKEDMPDSPFTPAPWIVKRSAGGTALLVCSVKPIQGLRRLAYTIAQIACPGDGKQAKANACLVAQAPDMYGALKQAIDYVRIVAESEEADVGDQELVEHITAVLAKAVPNA